MTTPSTGTQKSGPICPSGVNLDIPRRRQRNHGGFTMEMLLTPCSKSKWGYRGIPRSQFSLPYRLRFTAPLWMVMRALLSQSLRRCRVDSSGQRTLRELQVDPHKVLAQSFPNGQFFLGASFFRFFFFFFSASSPNEPGDLSLFLCFSGLLPIPCPRALNSSAQLEDDEVHPPRLQVLAPCSLSLLHI